LPPKPRIALSRRAVGDSAKFAAPAGIPARAAAELTLDEWPGGVEFHLP